MVDKIELNAIPTYTYTLRCHYRLEDGSMWDLDIDDYDRELQDFTIKQQFEAIMAENLFAPYGLSIGAIDYIEKIITSKEEVEAE